MSVRIEWVAYGPPAASRLHAELRAAKGGDPLAPVTVIVPSNHVGVATRRMLGSGALGPVCGRGEGVAAVTFLTVYRLAELLGSPVLAEQGCRPVSTPVLAAALRRALADDPGVFGPVAAHPATETALVGAYRELRDLSAGALDALARRGARAADVVRLHRAARATLEHNWYDEEDLTTAAAARAADGADPAGLGPPILFLPQRISRHCGRLLAAVAERAELVVLAGATGDERADAEVVATARLLAGAAEPGPPPGRDPLDVVDTARTRIVTTSDADEEVRAAVRAVIDAVRHGTPLERIAILYATPEPYGRLVHEQLAADGIAANGAAAVPLTARLAGRSLRGLLALPATSFRREEVFAWLAGARVYDGTRPAPVAAWERLSRDAGVVAGRRHWDELLATHAAGCDAEADAADADPDAPEWRAESLRAEAGHARALRAFVLRVIDELQRAADRPRPWGERATWAQHVLDNVLGGEGGRARWPLVEQKAAERVARAVERLGCLDDVEPSTPLDVFTRTLDAELEADLGRVGRMGEGVLTGSVAMGVGLDLDLVVVLGLAEGSFPAAVREDSLLPDDERAATGNELARRADGVERQHRHLLASLAGAGHHLLCVPRGDLRRSAARVPSRWVTDVAAALADERLAGAQLLSAPHPWMEHVASFDAGIRAATSPADEQEYRLRALLAAGGAGTLGDGVLGRARDVVDARRSRQFTRFDGNVAGFRIPSPAEHTASATRLEGWARCPYAYFVHDVLRAQEVENPEDRLQISPLDRGNLVHAALETFILEVLARPPTEQPGPDEPWSDADRRRMVEIAEDQCRSFGARGLTGRAIFWERDRRRIVAELEQVVVRDSAERAVRHTRPRAAELAFGFPGGPGAVELLLPDGRAIGFRGKADRLDVAEDGSLHVVDYKTGKIDDYKGISQDNPDCGGTRLQLVVYGTAARQLHGHGDTPAFAEYWFTSERGGYARIGYELTPEVVDRVSASVGTIVEGIESGVFPAHPTSQSTAVFVDCPYCDPDGLGVTGLRRDMDRKRTDPALAKFLALVRAGGDDDRSADTDTTHTTDDV